MKSKHNPSYSEHVAGVYVLDDTKSFDLDTSQMRSMHCNVFIENKLNYIDVSSK